MIYSYICECNNWTYGALIANNLKKKEKRDSTLVHVVTVDGIDEHHRLMKYLIEKLIKIRVSEKVNKRFAHQARYISLLAIPDDYAFS